MPQLSQDISKAYTRTFFSEDAGGVDAGAILKQGSADKETGCLLATADTDRLIGVAANGQSYNKPVTVVEHGGYVIMTCDKAIADLNLPLYVDASNPQRITDALSATPGTYFRVGFSKTTTAAAGDQILVFVDIAPVVVS